ncbi:Mss4-like protein [Mycena vitilis]|nr:Mss4-like protein [Mycena vitilis]
MSSPADTKSLPVPWPENAELKVHTGGCHCKKIRFEFEHPDIYTMPIVNCNCSICEDRGYLNVFVLLRPFCRRNVTWHPGSADDLTLYAFGSKNVSHRFCSTCGTSIGPAFPSRGFVVINTRTIDDIDLKRLQLHPVDGRARGPTTA